MNLENSDSKILLIWFCLQTQVDSITLTDSVSYFYFTNLLIFDEKYDRPSLQSFWNYHFYQVFWYTYYQTQGQEF